MGMRMIASIMIIIGIICITVFMGSLCMIGFGLLLLMGAMPLWKAGGIKSRYY